MTRHGWVALAALAAVACSKLEEPPKIPTAILHLYAQSGGTARPEGIFVTAPPQSFPDSRAPIGGCSLADLVNLPVGTLSNLDAGDSVAFISDSGTTYLYPRRDAAGNESYLPIPSFVPLTPGSAVSFQIPGAANGFASATFTALTARAITQLSTIPGTVAVSDSVVVTWSPAGDDSSGFEVALQYGTEDAAVPNRQVLCQWKDVGRGVIQGGILSEWSVALVRQIDVSRYRTAQQEVTGGGLIFFLATYDLKPLPGP